MGRLLLLVATGLCLTLPVSAAAKTHEVLVGNFFFSPQSLTIETGDTVKWTWVEGLHNTTSGHPDDLENAGLLWSNAITESSPTFQYTFSSAGAFPFYCAVHPAMQGSILVEDGTDIQKTTWSKIKRIFDSSSPSSRYFGF